MFLSTNIIGSQICILNPDCLSAKLRLMASVTTGLVTTYLCRKLCMIRTVNDVAYMGTLGNIQRQLSAKSPSTNSHVLRAVRAAARPMIVTIMATMSTDTT